MRNHSLVERARRVARRSSPVGTPAGAPQRLRGAKASGSPRCARRQLVERRRGRRGSRRRGRGGGRRARQSIQATRVARSRVGACQRGHRSSRSPARSVSTRMQRRLAPAAGAGWRRVTTPVRPMPPAVAPNSRVAAGVTDRTLAVGGDAASSGSTWSPKLPSRWWFLPWMSAAMAPPTVTCRVPGVTGTNQPRGSSARISVVEAGARRRRSPSPSLQVERAPPGERGHVEDGPAGVLRGVAVGAAQAAGEDAARRRRRAAASATSPSPRRRRPWPRSAPCRPSRSAATGRRPVRHRTRPGRRRSQTRPTRLRTAVAQHDLLRRAGPARSTSVRSAASRRRTGATDSGAPGQLARPVADLEGPQAVRGEGDGGRDAPHEAQVARASSRARMAAVSAAPLAEGHQLGVALAGDDEQRAERRDDEEPARERQAGRGAARDGPQQEPDGDDGRSTTRWCLRPRL